MFRVKEVKVVTLHAAAPQP